MVDLRSLVGKLAELSLYRQKLAKYHRYLNVARLSLSSHYSIKDLLHEMAIVAPGMRAVSVEYVGNFREGVSSSFSRGKDSLQDAAHGNTSTIIASDQSKFPKKTKPLSNKAKRSKGMAPTIRAEPKLDALEPSSKEPDHSSSISPGMKERSVFPNVGFLLQNALTRLSGIQYAATSKRGKSPSAEYSLHRLPSGHSVNRDYESPATSNSSYASLQPFKAMHNIVRAAMLSAPAIIKIPFAQTLALESAVRIRNAITYEQNPLARSLLLSSRVGLRVIADGGQRAGSERLGAARIEHKFTRKTTSDTGPSTNDQGKLSQGSTSIAPGIMEQEINVSGKDLVAVSSSNKIVMRLPGIVSAITVNLPLWGRAQVDSWGAPQRRPIASSVPILKGKPSSLPKRNTVKPSDSIRSPLSSSLDSIASEGPISKAPFAQPYGHPPMVAKAITSLSKNLPYGFNILRLQKLFSLVPFYKIPLEHIISAENRHDDFGPTWSLTVLRLKNLLIDSLVPGKSHAFENAAAPSNIVEGKNESSSIGKLGFPITDRQERRLPLVTSMWSCIQSGSSVSEITKRAMARTLGIVLPQTMGNRTISKILNPDVSGMAGNSLLSKASAMSSRGLPIVSPKDMLSLNADSAASEQARIRGTSVYRAEDEDRTGVALSSLIDADKVSKTKDPLIKSVSRLSQIYSRYTFDRFIRPPKTDSSKGRLYRDDPRSNDNGGGRDAAHGSSVSLLLASRTVVPAPISKTYLKGDEGISAARIRKMKEGSDKLPIPSKLQTVLANSIALQTANRHSQSALALTKSLPLSFPIPPTAAGFRTTRSAYSSLQTQGSQHTSSVQPLLENSSNMQALSGKRDFARSEPRYAASSRDRNEKPGGQLSLRVLRKMMEQIFQDELKRYGL